MDFIEAARYIFTPLKYFSVTPFKIYGHSGQRNVVIDKKLYIFSSGFLIYLIVFNFFSHLNCEINTIDSLIITFSKYTFTSMLFICFLISKYYQRDILQIYKECLLFSDQHPKFNKYFSLIRWWCVVKYFLLFLNWSMELQNWIQKEEHSINTMFFSDLFFHVISFLSLILCEFYLFLCQSYIQVILIVFMYWLHGLNAELLNSIVDTAPFSKLFTLLDKIIYIFEINIFLIVTSIFLWSISIMFNSIAHFLNDSEILNSDMILIANSIIHILHYVILLGYFGEKFNLEVGECLIRFTFLILNASIQML